MSDAELSVQVMPTRVRIARLLQEAKSSERPGFALLDVLGPVLKSLLSNDENTFFELILDCPPPSDSEQTTDHREGKSDLLRGNSGDGSSRKRWRPAVSLIMDESCFANFRQESLETFKDSWRPIRVLEASGGFATDQLVALLRPLSKNRISIMNVSTFNDDFLLCDDELKDDVVSNILDSCSTSGSPLSPSTVREVRDSAYVLLMPQTFVMVNHPAEVIHEFLPSITQVLLSCTDGETDHGFVSVCRAADDVSWVMPRELFNKFETSALVRCIGDFRGLQLRGTFAEHVHGVVDSFCAPLADSEFEVLSMSSYWTNTMLLRDEDTDTAVDRLRDAGFRVEVDDQDGGIVSGSGGD